LGEPESPYGEVLGPRYGDLAPAVRAMHGARFSARGTLDVTHGPSRIARALARISGAPPERRACPVTLDVAPEGRGFRWARSYDGHLVVTEQWVQRGRVVEALSGLGIHFSFEVEPSGALVYRHEKTTLGRGALTVSLPLWLGPRAEGRVAPNGEGSARISVSVRLPIVGLLVAYEGLMHVDPHGEDRS